MTQLEKILKKLNTPEKIQDFLNTLKFNFEKKGETCMSPKRVIEKRMAHCFEGALLAAAAIEMQGYKPLLLDLKASGKDMDHVVALFKRGKYWGAISKTNHSVLRYREPVYASVRELAMSYFHEYFLPDGTKTLKSFSKPFDLSIHRGGLCIDWKTSDKDLFILTRMLDESPHTQIVPKGL